MLYESCLYVWRDSQRIHARVANAAMVLNVARMIVLVRIDLDAEKKAFWKKAELFPKGLELFVSAWEK